MLSPEGRLDGIRLGLESFLEECGPERDTDYNRQGGVFLREMSKDIDLLWCGMCPTDSCSGCLLPSLQRYLVVCGAFGAWARLVEMGNVGASL